MVSTRSTQRDTFQGFEPLTANFIYCPNQFFDVGISNCSRGAIRLVAYILRKTLGYLDENGDPITQDVAVPYLDLARNAGISTRSIPAAIDEALKMGFICRVRAGKRSTSGQPAQTALYRLRWDNNAHYAKTRESFNGFFAGEGHRTPIPNTFFDHIIHHEKLSVIKVVATVLRYTVGYQNQFGQRRPSAPLSYSFIQKTANLKHRATLAEALRIALARGYIERTENGVFDPGGRTSRAARYGVKWLTEAKNRVSTAKTEPAKDDHSKNRTGSTAESEPKSHGKNRTARNTNTNDTFKQQDAAANSKTIELLQATGFDIQSARKLAESRGLAEIKRQIDWLKHRDPKNPLGMLRRAIEEDWPEPIAARESKARQSAGKAQRKRNAALAAERKQSLASSERKQQSRSNRLITWTALPDGKKASYFTRAIELADSSSERALLKRHQDLANPPTQVLALVDDSTTAR